MKPLRENFTVGVEEEYQLVAPEGGELRSHGTVVLAGDRSGAVEGEVQETMLEVSTPIATTAAELALRLRERRFQAAAAAAAEDLDLLAVGSHPFSSWQRQQLTDAERPRMLATFFRQVLRQQHICGMHIHVGTPEELDRVALMNVVRAFSPHLLALSCSSPFHLGEDTGFASFRSIIWRAFPFAGVPPRFASNVEYREFIQQLLRSGVIPDERTVYWSVRPSSRYPTLELRMCDVCPRMADGVAIAALARVLVVAAAERLLDPVGSSLSPPLQDEVLAENEWIVGRDGLEAALIAPETPRGRIPVREAIAGLISSLEPLFQKLGDADQIVSLERILNSGNAADRIRARQPRIAGMPELVDWLVQETRVGTGLDRRAENR